MAKQAFKVPEIIRCHKCQINLIYKNEPTSYPDKSVPPEKIRNENNRSKPNYSIMCPYCSDYHMNKPDLK